MERKASKYKVLVTAYNQDGKCMGEKWYEVEAKEWIYAHSAASTKAKQEFKATETVVNTWYEEK